MDILREQSIKALEESRLIAPEDVFLWIDSGGDLLKKYSLMENDARYNLRDNEIDAEDAANAILDTGIITTDYIIGYHGTYDKINEGGLTDKYLSVSLCLGVALEFGDNVVKVNIPPGVPAFYVSAAGLLRGETDEETEMEILLPQGRWTNVKSINESCGCEMRDIQCDQGRIHILEADYLPL
jgi:hypothetical protein